MQSSFKLNYQRLLRINIVEVSYKYAHPSSQISIAVQEMQRKVYRINILKTI